MEVNELRRYLPGFTKEIYNILVEKGKIVDLPEQQVLLKEGYFVNSVPLVLEGLIKVTRRDDEKEILLYYINQGESCIMSFSACIFNTTSKIFAITEKPSRILLISSSILNDLIAKYPQFNKYFHQLFQNRYEELIGTIDQFVFKKFDERLYHYLIEKSNKLNTHTINITHHEISQDLGTVREVVSRALKKLENEEKIKLSRNKVEIL